MFKIAVVYKILIRYIFLLVTLIQCFQHYIIICSDKRFLIFLLTKIQGLLLFGGHPDPAIRSLLWSLSTLWCLFHLVAIVMTNLETPEPFVMASVSTASKNSALRSDLRAVLRQDPHQGQEGDGKKKKISLLNK